MTTYLINHLRIPNGAPNSDGLTYLENVEVTFKPFGGRWLVLDAPVEVLEGAWPGAVVLMEFPDMATAKNWYHSPGYQKILSLRTGNAISDLILVDPVGPGFTSAGWARRIRASLGQQETAHDRPAPDHRAMVASCRRPPFRFRLFPLAGGRCV
jgi:uncharacterized protein (DUF1330 family)